MAPQDPRSSLIDHTNKIKTYKNLSVHTESCKDLTPLEYNTARLNLALLSAGMGS